MTDKDAELAVRHKPKFPSDLYEFGGLPLAYRTLLHGLTLGNNRENDGPLMDAAGYNRLI